MNPDERGSDLDQTIERLNEIADALDAKMGRDPARPLTLPPVPPVQIEGREN